MKRKRNFGVSGGRFRNAGLIVMQTSCVGLRHIYTLGETFRYWPEEAFRLCSQGLPSGEAVLSVSPVARRENKNKKKCGILRYPGESEGG